MIKTIFRKYAWLHLVWMALFQVNIICAQAPSTKQKVRTIIIDAGHGLPDGGAAGKYSQESDLTEAIASKLGKRLESLLPDCKILYTRTDENLPNNLADKNAANRWRAKFANENNGDLFIAIHVNSTNDRFSKEIIGHKEATFYSGKGKKRKKHTRSIPIYKYHLLPCEVEGTETYIWAVGKNDQKKQIINSNEDRTGEQTDSTDQELDTPEGNILASLRTKKYFEKSLQLASYVEEEFAKEGRTSLGVKQRNNQGIWVLQATAMPSILVETGFICNPDEEDYLNSEKGQDEVSYAVMRAVLRYVDGINNGTPTEKK